MYLNFNREILMSYLRGFSCFLLSLFFFAGNPADVQSQTNFQLISSFDGPSGSQPYSTLVEDSSGVLYGTTFSGGSNTTRGTVFRVMKDGGDFRVLRHFASGAGGSRPPAGVIEASDGALYGVTGTGGSNGPNGTIFKLNKDGSGYTAFWHFTGTVADGRQPQTGLIEGRDGFLYGTTFGAGASVPGSVFKIRKDGTGFSVLHLFEGTGDGMLPWGTLLEGSDDAIYGTTYSGTTGSSIFGTIFKVSKDGSGYQILRYCSVANGAYPYGGLIETIDGALYGTTTRGGSADNYGTVFKINKDGTGHKVIFVFSGTDGAQPRGTLAEGTGGVLYGATFSGGNSTNGTVFRFNKDGSGYTVLHRFADDGSDGRGPAAGVLVAKDGAIYGTTAFGGNANLGTIFKLSAPAPNLVVLSIAKSMSNAQLNLNGGIPGIVYRIQATTNLSLPNGWSVLGPMEAGLEGVLQFLDTNTSVYPARFYRSVTP